MKKVSALKFSHSTEIASPGYYEVFLEDDGIKAQMTTSERAGIHQYTFTREKDKKFILIDFDHRDDLIFAEYIFDGKKHISGQRTSKSWADEQHFYFDLEFSIEPSKIIRVKKQTWTQTIDPISKRKQNTFYRHRHFTSG